MATLYHDAAGALVQLIKDDMPPATIPPPPDAGSFRFSDADNHTLTQDIHANWKEYVVTGGVLKKAGVPVMVAAPSLSAKLDGLANQTQVVCALVQIVEAMLTQQQGTAPAPAWALSQLAAAKTWISQQGG